MLTDSNTLFFKGWHEQGSLSDVIVGGTVNVGGSFDTTKQTLTAKAVGLH